jgi:hypothetical protein
MSVESLLWPTGEAAEEEAAVHLGREEMKALFTEEQQWAEDEVATAEPQKPVRLEPWNLESDRYRTWKGADHNAVALWRWLMNGKGRKLAPAIGLVLDEHAPPPTVFRSRRSGKVAVEVHSVRTALRRSPRGAPVTDLVVEITQRRRGYFNADTQLEKDRAAHHELSDDGDFRYRAGCTLLMNPVTMEVRRVIRTPGTVADNKELERVRHFIVDGGLASGNAFDAGPRAFHASEPFALLHRHGEHDHG